MNDRRSKLIKVAPFVAVLVGTCITLLASCGRTRPPLDAEQLRSFDQPEEAAAFYLKKRLPIGMTELSVERYIEASARIRKMATFSTALGKFVQEKTAPGLEPMALVSTWTPLGPGNIGGRTRSLAINPDDPQIMYAGAVSGGVWKSTDSGRSWSPLADLLPNIAVSCLAIAPGKTEIVYCGTGEGFGNGDAVRGAGIFRSTDGGLSWTYLNSTLTQDFYYINDLVISPNNSNRLYAATGTGVWRSTNGGNTWERTLEAKSLRGFYDLAIRTDLSTDYLVATSAFSFEPSEVFLNADAGGQGVWSSVLSEPGMDRTSLAFAPSNQNILYALAGGSRCLGAVFRSGQGGAAGSWTAQVRGSDPPTLNSVLLCNPILAFQSNCFGKRDQFNSQGWYDNVIAVDPMDPERVWAGGVDLFRSDDGGRNWGLASYWWTDPGNPQFVHADQHAIVFHPQYNGSSNQTLFVANDGGIFRTDNARGATATGPRAPCDSSNSSISWRSLNSNYQATQFYHGTSFPDGTSYIGGTQDNGVIFGTESFGINGWTRALGGDGGFVVVDPIFPNIVYAGNAGLSISKSLNGGGSWTSATNGINDRGFIFIPPIVLDSSDPSRLWTGGFFAWRSKDRAGSWSRASRGLVDDYSVSAIAVAPTNPNRVFIGTSGSASVHRTDNALTADAGTDWPFTRLRDLGFVSSLTFDPVNADVAYATVSTFKMFPSDRYVYKTTDGGITWTGIDGTGATGLPDAPVHCIVVDPTDRSRLYVGTDVGVFVSIDGGASWARENTGFANAPTAALAINTHNGISTLYAFTHGRGAWRVTLPTSCASPVTNAGPFGPQGGRGIVAVAAPDGCDWLSVSDVAWIRITAGVSGSGNGLVEFSVDANSSGNTRTGNMTIAGRVFTITQPGNQTGPRINSVTDGKKHLF
ncbi:MAG TPA: BACON domain-containing carbohydrate-binding protein, partial [Blastocatellia bacterium]|nr:BACON domain-containing carbohydrate-binding protein [Blastocatellia bacterium]